MFLGHWAIGSPSPRWDPFKDNCRLQSIPLPTSGNDSVLKSQSIESFYIQICVLLRWRATYNTQKDKCNSYFFLHSNDLFKFCLSIKNILLHFFPVEKIRIKLNILVKDWSSRNGTPHKHDQQNSATRLISEGLKTKLEMVGF